MSAQGAWGNPIGAGPGPGDSTTRGDNVVPPPGSDNRDQAPPVPESIKAMVRDEAANAAGGTRAGGLEQEALKRGGQAVAEGAKAGQTVVQSQDAADMNVHADPTRTRADLERMGQGDKK